MGMASFPDNVGLMAGSGVLITDLSSFATDCDGSGRQVALWDRPCPISDLRISPQDRLDAVDSSIGELLKVVDTTSSDDAWSSEEDGSKQQKHLERAHEAGLDGRAGSRLIESLSSEVLA